MHKGLAAIVLATGLGHAASVSAQPPTLPKQALAVRAPAGSVRLDGRLDDEVWGQARAITDFIQKEPVEGAPPSDAMDIRFVYDNDTLFVAARMYAHDLTSISMPLGRRDDGQQADHLLIELDSYLDRRTAYAFGVTASGVRLDHFHASDDEGDFDAGFDPVWDVRVRTDAAGWTAEMSIPLSQLRFTLHNGQVWGLNVSRWVPSRNESVYWIAVPRTEQGWSSRFGELRGLNDVRPARRLELLPYVASGGTFGGNGDARNPFDSGRNVAGRFGADLKIGFGSNLTLDGTVNPDFGQLEADPAEVNLSVFETFFEERRPFFLEGSGLLLSRVGDFFYSRRIGAAPVGPASGDFIDYPGASTIIGAAKLTGRLASGTSIGVLGAVTDAEHASTFDLASDSRSRIRVAPRTTYAVSRVQQEFGSSASTVAIMATAVRRDLAAGDPLAALLLRNSVTLSGDSLLRFRGGEYEVVAGGGLTFVNGEPAAVDSVQRNSARYFQRPDRAYGTYDPSRESMVGANGFFSVARTSGTHWLWGASSGTESPAFEPNVLGSLGTADGTTTDAWIRYRETMPGRILRSYSIELEQFNEWNYGGERQGGSLQGRVDLSWANFWGTSASIWLDPAVPDQRLTRGGPLMRRPGMRNAEVDVTSPSSRHTQGNVNLYYGSRDDTGFIARFSGGFSLRPTPPWQLSINPSYSRDIDHQQYVTTLDGGSLATYGSRYVFARVDRSTYAAQVRLNYTLRPDLNVDAYMEPFASSGRYGHVGELEAPGSGSIREYGDAEAEELQIDVPDFKVQSFRSNVVVRWEWRPGSTFYAVWQQNRSAETLTGSRASARDMFSALTVPGDNVVAIKASFWLRMR